MTNAEERVATSVGMSVETVRKLVEKLQRNNCPPYSDGYYRVFLGTRPFEAGHYRTSKKGAWRRKRGAMRKWWKSGHVRVNLKGEILLAWHLAHKLVLRGV